VLTHFNFEKKIPDQWLVVKTIPVYKTRGSRNILKTTDPLPTCMLCLKYLKKGSLKRILEIQEPNGVNLTSKN
jgi:hypothetical protein